MPSYFSLLETVKFYFLIVLGLLFMTPTSYACFADYCSQSHHKTMEIRGVDRGQNYEYCQILKELGHCLNATASTCHANVRFHALKVYKDKHWKSHRCDNYKFRPKDETGESCPFWAPVHDHSRLRYCSLFGHPHLRRFDGDFETCDRQGTYPLIDNRYFLVQVTYLALSDQETSSSITSITLIIKNHTGCAVQTQYEAGIEDPGLSHTFTDGRDYVGDYEQKTVELIHHNNSYVEIRIVYISSEIRIRRQGPYLSVAVRVPDRLVYNDYDGGSPRQMCQHGCSGPIVPMEQALSQPFSYAKCMRDGSIRTPKELAIERCQSAHLYDDFFDACLFDLLMSGDEKLLTLTELAQHDYRYLYGSHHHRGRQDLAIYETHPIRPFTKCRKRKPSQTVLLEPCHSINMMLIVLCFLLGRLL